MKINSKNLVTTAQKLQEVDKCLEAVGHVTGTFLQLDSAQQTGRFFIGAKSSDTSSYELSRAVEKALLEYRETLERKLRSAVRPEQA